MLIRGVTLPGAMEGIMYYIKPDFGRLTDAQVKYANTILVYTNNQNAIYTS